MDEYDIIKSNLLPAAESVSDNDTLLAVQDGALKRVKPSLMKGKQGDSGKTPVLEAGNITKGDSASGSIVQNGTDADGNPIYKVNLILPKGDQGIDGKIPVFGSVTVTTGDPGSKAVFTYIRNGVDAYGNPKWDVEITIPKGDTGNTPVLLKGDVTSGVTADASIEQNGVDPSGNPIYKIGFTLPKGDQGITGKTPVPGIVTVSTLDPGQNAAFVLVQNGTDADGNPVYDITVSIPRGIQGNVGATPVLQKGLVSSGTDADVSISQNGVDANGNPIYQIGFTLPKGDQGNTGKTPVFVSGTTTTGAAGSNADLSIEQNGVDENGNPKYLINATLPKGADGSLGQGDAKDLTATFTEATERSTIESGSTIATLFGKIKKWFTDFAAVAFSGSYTDLTNKPTIPTVPSSVSSFTNDSNYQTDTNVNNLIGAHNTSASAHQDIRTSLSNIQAIAEGKSRARVFATVAALDTWLSDSANTAILQIGDNFYITETDVSDFWWDGSARQPLETDKVSLTEYIKSSEAAATYVAKVSGTTAHESGLYKVTTNADGIVTAVVEVAKRDITALGIPAEDTTYEDAYMTDASHAVHGLMPATDKVNIDRLFSNYSVDQILAFLDFYKGSVDVTTLASLPDTKRCINAALSAATTISLAAALTAGQELYISCTPSASFTQAIPNTGVWRSKSGASYSAVSGTVFDISIYCYKDGYYDVKILEPQS